MRDERGYGRDDRWRRDGGGGHRRRDRDRDHRPSERELPYRRSRSRSRSRSPEPYRRRERYRPHRRSRSPGEPGRRDWERDRAACEDGGGRRGGERDAEARREEKKKAEAEAADLGPREDEDEEAAMMRLMGFSGFDSTSGKEVEGNAAAGTVKVKSKRQARQYMNRRGGFNRPLPKEKTGEKIGGD